MRWVYSSTSTMDEFLDLGIAYVLFEETRKCAPYVRE